MKTLSKGFIAPLLLALIAVLLIGGGVYVQKNQTNQSVVSPTTQATSTAQASDSQTTGWKTYTNAKYGFEFEYPDNFVKSFEQESTDTDAAKLIVDFRVSGCFIVEGGGGLNEPKCRLYEVIVKGSKVTEDGVGVAHISTQMGGETAEKLIWSEGGTSWTSIQAQYQGQWYVQQLIYPAGSSDGVLNTIVRSFRFIR